MHALKVLVIARPDAEYLSLLDGLPHSPTVIKGTTLEQLREHAADADVILNGMNAGEILREVFPLAHKVRWVHSLSAGVENALNPALAASTVPLTNARGVFKDSLAEWVIAACLFFAKDLRRLVRSQQQSRWDQFDVRMLSGATLGVIGYGEIGRAAAVRAHALGMRIIAARRRPELCASDPIVSRAFATDRRIDLIRESDYVLLATPQAAHTEKLMGEQEIAAMKPGAVLINVGRGNSVDEMALAQALQQKRIGGAALDVFREEPLPAGHPFWSLENVLLSPHSADHTTDWLHKATELFVTNFKRFAEGQPLLNVVDKQAGY